MRANSELPLLFFVFFLLFLCVLRVLLLAAVRGIPRFSRWQRSAGRDARSLLRRRACGASYQLPLAPPPLLLPPPQLLELLELLELLKLLLLSEGGGRTGSTLRSV